MPPTSSKPRNFTPMKHKRVAPDEVVVVTKEKIHKRGTIVKHKQRAGDTVEAAVVQVEDEGNMKRRKRSRSVKKRRHSKVPQEKTQKSNGKKLNQNDTVQDKMTKKSQQKQVNDNVEDKEEVSKPKRKKRSKKRTSVAAATEKPPPPPSQNHGSKSTKVEKIQPLPSTKISTKPQQSRPRPTRAKIVMIDGTSAAAAFGSNGSDMKEAVSRAIAYYEERCVEAIAVVPFGTATDDDKSLAVVIAPPGATTRHVALREAARRDGDLLCNHDLELDLARQKGRARRRKMRRFLQRHWIPFTFIDGQLLPNPHPRRLLESVHAPRVSVKKRSKAMRILARMGASSS